MNNPLTHLSNHESNNYITSSKNRQEELLNQLLHELRHPLKVFVKDILDSPIGQQFKVLPASIRHHHNQPKGLLIHSLECALMAGQIALTWMNRAEAELTMVAALFHDIGKCRTLQSSSGYTYSSQFVSHESLTLELIGPYLAELELNWKIGANMLRHLLTKESNKTQFSAFPGKLLIKMADQFSTAINRRQTIFEGRPNYHYYAYDKHCKQPYLRVPN